jgi:hypothetical protein
MKNLLVLALIAVVFGVFSISCDDSKKNPLKSENNDKEQETEDKDEPELDKDNETDDKEPEIQDEPEVEPDEDEIIDENQYPDEIPDETPDEEQAPIHMCDTNSDCSWQFICDYFQDPRDCIKIGACENDYDCPGMQKCVEMDHWNECVVNTSPKICTKDEDCGKGEFCEEVNLLKICRSKNKCSSNDHCGDKEECIFEDGYYQCINTAPCELHTDCQFGYKCEVMEPENECVYANECLNDEDCGALSACAVEENWTACKVLGGGFCTKDEDCQLAEYCDIMLGLGGVCKSRNKCYEDEHCNDEKLKCEFNGVYNDCVPKSPEWCLLDEMCDEGWYCIDNKCTPPNFDQCKEIAGKWTVRFSELSMITFQDGEVYEFLPKEGCNGDIKKEGATVFLGSFKETSKSNYDFDFYLVYKCTTVIYLGNLMNISCPDGSAQLARF